MGVVGAGDVFGGGFELHGDDGLGDHVGGVGAKDVDAEDAVGLGVGDDLDLSDGFVHALGAAVGGEGELADLDLVAGLEGVLLGVADGGELGVGVDDAGDGV